MPVKYVVPFFANPDIQKISHLQGFLFLTCMIERGTGDDEDYNSFWKC